MLNSKIYNLLFRGWFKTQERSSRYEYILRILMLPIFYMICDFSFKIYHLHEDSFICIIYGFIAAFIISPIGIMSVLQVFFVTHRRLHDLNASGWWQLMMIIPCRQLMMIGFIFFKGTEGSNKYGDPPEY